MSGVYTYTSRQHTQILQQVDVQCMHHNTIIRIHRLDSLILAVTHPMLRLQVGNAATT